MKSRSLVPGLLAACVLVLAGCGADKEPTTPGLNIATVSGSGRHLDIGADEERGNYPDACRLLPDDSVAALLGGPANATNTISGCAWSTGRASYPSLGVTWVELGSDAADTYGDSRPSGASSVRPLDGVGQRARIYREVSSQNDNKTIGVDVLKSNAFFRVEVMLVTTSANDVGEAEQIASRVATLVAGQVS